MPTLEEPASTSSGSTPPAQVAAHRWGRSRLVSYSSVLQPCVLHVVPQTLLRQSVDEAAQDQEPPVRDSVAVAGEVEDVGEERGSQLLDLTGSGAKCAVGVDGSPAVQGRSGTAWAGRAAAGSAAGPSTTTRDPASHGCSSVDSCRRREPRQTPRQPQRESVVRTAAAPTRRLRAATSRRHRPVRPCIAVRASVQNPVTTPSLIRVRPVLRAPATSTVLKAPSA